MAFKTYFNEVQTSATGANWVTLPNIGLSRVTIWNSSNVTIEVRRADDTSKVLPLLAYTALELSDENANKYEIRRQDQNNTQVTIPLVVEKS